MDGGQRLWDCFGFIWLIVGIWRSLDIFCAHFGLLGLPWEKVILGVVGMCDIVWANHLELRAISSLGSQSSLTLALTLATNWVELIGGDCVSIEWCLGGDVE